MRIIAQRFHMLVALFLMISVLSGCWLMGDPGYSMDPVNMEKVENGNQWTKKFDGFELQTNKIGGLKGEWWIDPYLSISSQSQPITIESIELQTQEKSYLADISEQSRIVPAFSVHKTLSISWQFSKDTSARKILGDSSRIIFHLKIGNEKRTAEIDYAHAR